MVGAAICQGCAESFKNLSPKLADEDEVPITHNSFRSTVEAIDFYQEHRSKAWCCETSGESNKVGELHQSIDHHPDCSFVGGTWKVCDKIHGVVLAYSVRHRQRLKQAIRPVKSSK